MDRWCIIATPRSGSNYLEEMLYLNIKDSGKFVMKLGEILHRVIWAYSDSEEEEFRADSLYNSTERINFRNKIFSKLESDTNARATIRLFVQEHHALQIDYKEFIKKLQSLNFKFIHLTRNSVDCAISLAMAENTGVWHRYTDQRNREAIDGNKEYAKNPSPINIPLLEFGKSYLEIKFHDYYNKNILKDIDHITIRYENILEDCKANNIPITEKTTIKKLHNIDYKNLIVNYKELQTFYGQLINER